VNRRYPRRGASPRAERDRNDPTDDVEVGAVAAITLQFEVGPETRELIERLAGTLILQLELGPETRKLIEDFRKRESEPRAAEVPPE
jgi:hypothetical protein